MEKILYKGFYWFAKIVRAAFLLGGFIILIAALKELFTVGFGTGLHALAMCLGLAAINLLGFILVVQMLILFEDIRAGV